MLKTFNCPACGGPLEYSAEAGHVIPCKFCGQSVMVPERGQAATTVITEAVGRGFRWLIIMAVGLVAISVLLIFVLRSGTSPSVEPAVTMPAPPQPAAPPPATPQGGAFEVVLSFGEEGIGPGRFEDARHIALDGEGYIYVGEYTGGRIQRFDGTGKFMTQWLADTERPLRGLAADRQGIVYVVQGGQIRRFQGATGKALDTWAAPPGFRPDGLYPAPDGGMLAFGGGASPAEVVRYDAQGQVQLRFETPARNARAALDGLGNIYVIGGFSERGKLHEAVFKYDHTGTFVNRFGSAGGEPGQFRATHTLVTDGRGRVYVSDIKGVHVFDGEGRFLEQLGIGRTLFGMIFNDDDELFVVERNAHRVMKVVLK